MPDVIIILVYFCFSVYLSTVSHSFIFKYYSLLECDAMSSNTNFPTFGGMFCLQILRRIAPADQGRAFHRDVGKFIPDNTASTQNPLSSVTPMRTSNLQMISELVFSHKLVLDWLPRNDSIQQHQNNFPPTMSSLMMKHH